MTAFVLSTLPTLTTRLSPTATAAQPTPHPSHRPRSSSTSTLYVPPNPNRPPLEPTRATGSPPTYPPSTHRRRDDDDDGGYISSPSILAAAAHLFHRYNALLQSAPLATKAVSAGILALISDVVAQALSDAPTNLLSYARFALYGLLCAGPQGHFWFQGLENMIRVQGAGGIAMKLLLDQLFFLPVTTAAFFVIMKVAEGRSMNDAMQFMRGSLKETIFSAWKVWPFVNAVNFAVVPTQMRVVFVSAVSVFWVAYLSVVSSGGGGAKKAVAATS